jgi:LEA14-like dessication related protein
MKPWVYVLLGFLVLGGAASIYYYERQIRLLADLNYQVIAFNLVQTTAAAWTVNLTLRISSKSNIEATVEAFTVDCYVNGALLGTVQPIEPFLIPANGFSDASLQVSVNPQVLTGDLISLLLSAGATNNFSVNLVGDVTVKEVFIEYDIPFNYATNLGSILPSL